MMSLTFGLFTQVSGSGPLGPLVFKILLSFIICSGKHFDRRKLALTCAWCLKFDFCMAGYIINNHLSTPLRRDKMQPSEICSLFRKYLVHEIN